MTPRARDGEHPALVDFPAIVRFVPGYHRSQTAL